MSSRYEAEIDVTLPNNTHAALVRLAGEQRRILELGAASGYMTRALKDRGNHITAIEYDDEAAEDLKQIADWTIVGDLNDPAVLSDVSGPFDTVLAGDVLEHLLDPRAVLQSAVSKLAPDGAVVISVPNVGHIDLRLALLQGRFDYQPTGLLDDTHIRFFTYDTLLDLIESAGLIVADIERITTNAFETEIAVDRDGIDQAILDAALAVPESETYQFVVRAVVDSGDRNARQQSERTLIRARDKELRRLDARANGPVGESISQQLEVARAYLLQTEHDRDAARQQIDALSAELAAARQQIDALTAELAAARQQIDALSAELAAALELAEISRRDAETQHYRAEQQFTGLSAELATARRELVAACVAESRARAEVAEQVAFVNDARARAERAEADQKLLAEIRGSRAYGAISRYRRLVNRVVPPSSARRAVLRPIARAVGLRW